MPGYLFRLPNPYWLGLAVPYVIMTVWLRGAVLRPLVPRFSIPGWLAAAGITSLIVLILTVGGSVIGVAVAKSIAASGRVPMPPPAGWPVPVFWVSVILAAEIMGAFLGSIPGLLIGVLEALIVGRSTRNMGPWILSRSESLKLCCFSLSRLAAWVFFDPNAPI